MAKSGTVRPPVMPIASYMAAGQDALVATDARAKSIFRPRSSVAEIDFPSGHSRTMLVLASAVRAMV